MTLKGQKLAAELAQAGISTTLIPDTAVFAMMSRVNQVVIGTHSVMANGGLKAVCGTQNLALAAKHHSVPVFRYVSPLTCVIPKNLRLLR